MEDLVRFGSRDYFLMALLLVFSRGMDIFSTWVATPNLMLEGNPISKKLGWRWGIPANFVMCIGFALAPVIAIAFSTLSVLVAARNFQIAWLMRSMGEENYRDWHVSRIRETRITLYLSCLAGNTLLTAGVGVAVMYFSYQAAMNFSYRYLVPIAVGMGIIAYAMAVALFSILAVWNLRREADRSFRRVRRAPETLVSGPALKSSLPDSCACETTQVPSK
jgi:hypothetical protein